MVLCSCDIVSLYLVHFVFILASITATGRVGTKLLLVPLKHTRSRKQVPRNSLRPLVLTSNVAILAAVLGKSAPWGGNWIPSSPSQRTPCVLTFVIPIENCASKSSRLIPGMCIGTVSSVTNASQSAKSMPVIQEAHCVNAKSPERIYRLFDALKLTQGSLNADHIWKNLIASNVSNVTCLCLMTELRHPDVVQHHVDTSDHPPIKQPVRRVLFVYRDIVFTAHAACTLLLTNQHPSPKLARWSMTIQEQDLDIHHGAGKSNLVADALSRNPFSTSEVLQIEVGFSSQRSTSHVGILQWRDEELAPIFLYLKEEIVPSDERRAKRLAQN